MTWEYNGKTYTNGGQFTGSQRGTVYDFTNSDNFFSPPSDIPFSAKKAGLVKLTAIKITSCSIDPDTDAKIMQIIYNLNK
jgi:hypothetical protein